MHCIQRGIYLDADVKDFRCFDEILDWDFFSSKHFIKEDGSLYTDKSGNNGYYCNKIWFCV